MLDLEGCWAKIERAREHLEPFKREMDEAAEQHPFRAVTHFDPNTGIARYGIQQVLPSSLRIAVMAGEIIHNLRSALDYIVFLLAKANNVTPTRWHQFPIYADPSEYAGSVGTDPHEPKVDWGPLQGITIGAYTVYEAQPFRRNK